MASPDLRSRTVFWPVAGSVRSYRQSSRNTMIWSVPRTPRSRTDPGAAVTSVTSTRAFSNFTFEGNTAPRRLHTANNVRAEETAALKTIAFRIRDLALGFNIACACAPRHAIDYNIERYATARSRH